MTMRTLIADDHALFREALKLVLAELHPGGEIIEAASAREVLDAVRRSAFDLTLLDLAMPGALGYDLVREAAANEQGKVVVVSASEDLAAIEASFEAGANGYIIKSTPIDTVRLALSTILAGETYSPVGRDQAGRQRRNPPSASLPAPLRDLTGRQLEVLTLLVRGNSNKLIARKLGMLDATVKVHLRQIYRKLGVKNRTQATALISQIYPNGLDTFTRDVA
jgi:DNA-binding NarL/FixJ family response regulator